MDENTTGVRTPHTPPGRRRKPAGTPDQPRRSTYRPILQNAKKPTLLGRLFSTGAKHRGRMTRKNALTVAGIAASLILGATATGMIATLPVAQTATAATYGIGYNSPDGFLGAYSHNGVNLYCLQITASPPMGSTSFAGNTQYSSMSADENAGVNAVVTEYGQSQDRIVTAATHLFVWSVSDRAEYNSHGMSGDDYYIARADAADRPAIRAKLAEIRAFAAGITASTVTATGGRLDLLVDGRNNYVGTLTVAGLPAGMSGTVTLTNGSFVDSGSSSMAGVTNGMVLNVRGIDGWDPADYKIRATGSFDGSGGYAGQIGLYTTPGQQDTAGPGPKGTSHIDLVAEDPSPRSRVFQPAVGTQVASVYVKKGEQICDTLEFYLRPDENGRVNELPVNPANGNKAPITATGVAYGPFNHQPAEADDAPAGSPVFDDTLSVTTSTTDGFDEPYTSCTNERAAESGFYNFQWSIDTADQMPAISALLPAGYLFKDRFGQVVETSIVPTTLRWESDIAKDDVMIGETNTDVYDVTLHDGAWLVGSDGKKIPATVTRYVRWSATEPEIAAEAPEDAELLATLGGEFTKTGETELGDIPAGYKAGYVNVQTCIAADNPNFEPWCDQYGLPSETFQVHEPKVTTAAQTDQTGTEVRDLIDVAPPFEGAQLPEGGILVGTDGYYIAPDAEHECTPENLVVTAEPILVTEWGQEYTEWMEVPAEKTDGGIQFLEHAIYQPDPDKEPLWQYTGDCTNVTEYTKIGKPTPPPAPAPAAAAPVLPLLADTGTDGLPLLLIGIGALTAGVAAMTIVIIRRRKQTATQE